ncbi:hypothetical protein J4477_03395 [Candidatus Pacearchaeota archaeon]|nr:hypothetical protein [Candidatus Pacearchaeota archaeon]
MKRGIVLFFILIFSFALVSALNVSIDKNNFKQGETLISSISGNVIEPIDKENVGFYKEHVQIPVTYGMVKINETYYIYGLLPFQEGNFSLRVKEVIYREFNQNKKQDLEINFTIGPEVADFGINPGAFLTSSSQDLFISNYLDKQITVYYENDNEENKSFIIPAQETKKFSININDFDNLYSGIIVFTSSTGFVYNIPAYIIKEDTGDSQNVNETGELSFSLSSINAQLKKGESYIYTTRIKNNGDRLDNFNLFVSEDIKKYVNLSAYNLSLDKEEQKEIKIIILFDKTGNFSGEITAKSQNSSDSIKLNFAVSEDVIPSSTAFNNLSCSNLKGKICSSTQKCSGNIEFTSDGSCCIGSCVDKNATATTAKSTNWIAVVVIVLILLLIAGFFFWKMKKTKRTARDILKDKSKSFSERYETKDKLRKY